MDPMGILKFLIPRSQTTFKLPPITLKETVLILKNLKNTNSTGYDFISNKILKKIKLEIAPHICHLINSIINTTIMPEILKLSRITPLLKPDKKINDIASYRNINNLPCVEKLVEQHIANHLNKYLNDNNILHPNHHGGRKGHSTASALLQITNQLNINYDKHMVSMALITDLSAAYDTVDHPILLKKMEHYGIVGNENLLFKSYLSNRKQYVSIDTYSSDILPSLNCSVIQGGKLSGTLYNIYTNEIPLLFKCLHTDKNNPFMKKFNVNYKNVDHLTVNFVDDSSNVIGFKDTNIVKNYVTDYYEVLHKFYTANKLKLNSDKTKYFLNYRPKYSLLLKNFFFMACNDKILPSNSIKILGVYIRSDLKLDTQIGKLCAELHNRIFNLKKLTCYTDFRTRNIFIKSYVMGKLMYAMPLYMSCNVANIEKLHKVIMSAARASIGNYCFKKSINYILNKCGFLTAKNMILLSTLCFYHKLHVRKKPPSILNLFMEPNKREKVRRYRPTYLPNLKQIENGCLYRGSSIFNSIPDEYKLYTAERFKNTIKGYIADRDVFDTCD